MSGIPGKPGVSLIPWMQLTNPNPLFMLKPRLILCKGDERRNEFILLMYNCALCRRIFLSQIRRECDRIVEEKEGRRGGQVGKGGKKGRVGRRRRGEGEGSWKGDRRRGENRRVQWQEKQGRIEGRRQKRRGDRRKRGEQEGGRRKRGGQKVREGGEEER